MNVKIASENLYLKHSINHMIINSDTHLRCNPNVLIVDLSCARLCEKISEIDHANICALIILTNSNTEEILLRYIDFKYPVFFLCLQESLDNASLFFSEVIELIKNKKVCHYKVNRFKTTHWIGGNELNAMRMYYKGLGLREISSTLSVSQKTSLNYIGSSIKKLRLDKGVDGYKLLRFYEAWLQGDGIDESDNILCNYRLFYLRSMV